MTKDDELHTYELGITGPILGVVLNSGLPLDGHYYIRLNADVRYKTHVLHRKVILKVHEDCLDDIPVGGQPLHIRVPGPTRNQEDELEMLAGESVVTRCPHCQERSVLWLPQEMGRGRRVETLPVPVALEQLSERITTLETWRWDTVKMLLLIVDSLKAKKIPVKGFPGWYKYLEHLHKKHPSNSPKE